MRSGGPTGQRRSRDRCLGDPRPPQRCVAGDRGRCAHGVRRLREPARLRSAPTRKPVPSTVGGVPDPRGALVLPGGLPWPAARRADGPGFHDDGGCLSSGKPVDRPQPRHLGLGAPRVVARGAFGFDPSASHVAGPGGWRSRYPVCLLSSGRRSGLPGHSPSECVGDVYWVSATSRNGFRGPDPRPPDPHRPVHRPPRSPRGLCTSLCTKVVDSLCRRDHPRRRRRCGPYGL